MKKNWKTENSVSNTEIESHRSVVVLQTRRIQVSKPQCSMLQMSRLERFKPVKVLFSRRPECECMYALVDVSELSNFHFQMFVGFQSYFVPGSSNFCWKAIDEKQGSRTSSFSRAE
jgi:hypothetical protein